MHYRIKCRVDGDYVAGVGPDPEDGFYQVFWTSDPDRPGPLKFENVKQARKFRSGLWSGKWAREHLAIVRVNA